MREIVAIQVCQTPHSSALRERCLHLLTEFLSCVAGGAMRQPDRRKVLGGALRCGMCCPRLQRIQQLFVAQPSQLAHSIDAVVDCPHFQALLAVGSN